MAGYSVNGSGTNTGSKTLVYTVNGSSSPRRLALYDNVWGASGTPGDQAAEYQIKRITAENMTPGGTALTPVAIDQASPAGQSNGVLSCTGEPTYASALPLLDIGLNQRSPFRWILHPGRECVVSASNDAGFGMFVNAVTSTWSASFTMIWDE